MTQEAAGANDLEPGLVCGQLRLASFMSGCPLDPAIKVSRSREARFGFCTYGIKPIQNTPRGESFDGILNGTVPR
jgi:hypothetical protein